MPDIITVGESMVMMVADQSDSLQFVTSYTRKIAGAESNVAIGLARLGHEVGWISALGEDPFGTYIRNTIRGEGVDTSMVMITPEYPTGLMVKERNEIGDPKVFYYRKGSAASHITPDILQPTYFNGARWLHVTGIFAALSESCRETLFAAIGVAKEKGMFISFDPNVRLQLWSKEQAKNTLLTIAGLSDLILPGIAEAELLLGTTEWQSVANTFHQQGNTWVIMKNGSDGAYHSKRESDGRLTQGYEKGFKVQRVVDTVGAGDGFAVGVISTMLEGHTLAEAVRRGNAIGSLAVTVQGDVEGYPTRKQLDEYLRLVQCV
jgi:2-dehydro-3-deoxygluconokinase